MSAAVRLSALSAALAVCAALVLPLSAAAEREIHAPQCLYGCPMGASSNNDLIFRDVYVLSSNDLTKLADWAAYRVSRETIGGAADRNWRADPALAADETLEYSDYAGARDALDTDKGHQAPLAGLSALPGWKMTNVLSNITPQKQNLNQGPWRNLESAVRKLAQKPETAAVYVMTGPLYERSMPRLPNADEAHMVPSGYWKIIAVENAPEEIRTAAFVFAQETPRDADYCAPEFSVTVRDVERLAKLDFFHALAPEIQEVLENSEPEETAEPGLSPALVC